MIFNYNLLTIFKYLQLSIFFLSFKLLILAILTLFKLILKFKSFLEEKIKTIYTQEKNIS